MNSFGVLEVASTKATRTPGWAYVADTGNNPPATTVLPTSRKRAARYQSGGRVADISSRQEAKLRKELEILDRDNQKDVQIRVPAKTGGRGN